MMSNDFCCLCRSVWLSRPDRASGHWGVGARRAWGDSIIGLRAANASRINAEGTHDAVAASLALVPSGAIALVLRVRARRDVDDAMAVLCEAFEAFGGDDEDGDSGHRDRDGEMGGAPASAEAPPPGT